MAALVLFLIVDAGDVVRCQRQYRIHRHLVDVEIIDRLERCSHAGDIDQIAAVDGPTVPEVPCDRDVMKRRIALLDLIVAPMAPQEAVPRLRRIVHTLCRNRMEEFEPLIVRDLHLARQRRGRHRVKRYAIPALGIFHRRVVLACRLRIEKVAVDTAGRELLRRRQVAVVAEEVEAEDHENDADEDRTHEELPLMRKQAPEIEVVNDFDDAAHEEESADEAEHGPAILIHHRVEHRAEQERRRHDDQEADDRLRDRKSHRVTGSLGRTPTIEEHSEEEQHCRCQHCPQRHTARLRRHTRLHIPGNRGGPLTERQQKTIVAVKGREILRKIRRDRHADHRPPAEKHAGPQQAHHQITGQQHCQNRGHVHEGEEAQVLDAREVQAAPVERHAFRADHDGGDRQEANVGDGHVEKAVEAGHRVQHLASNREAVVEIRLLFRVQIREAGRRQHHCCHRQHECERSTLHRVDPQHFAGKVLLRLRQCELRRESAAVQVLRPEDRADVERRRHREDEEAQEQGERQAPDALLRVFLHVFKK